MKRLLVTAAIALSMTAAAQAANYTTMFASNYWRVTHMVRNNDGNPMCNMQSQLAFNNSTGWVMIKWTKGQPNPFVHLSKTSWHFADNIQVPFSVSFDNNRRELFAVSKNTNAANYSHIIAQVTKDEGNLDNWLDNFASSETMTINFRSGNERQWSVKMTGSRDASKSFQSCLKAIETGTTPVPQAGSDIPNDVSSAASAD